MDSSTVYVKLTDAPASKKSNYDIFFRDLNSLIKSHKQDGHKRIENNDLQPYFLHAFDADHIASKLDGYKKKNPKKS